MAHGTHVIPLFARARWETYTKITSGQPKLFQFIEVYSKHFTWGLSLRRYPKRVIQRYFALVSLLYVSSMPRPRTLYKTNLSTNDDGSIVGSTTNLYPYFNLPLLSFPWHLFPKHRHTVHILSVISGFPRLLKSFWLTLCQGHSSQQCIGTSQEWAKRLDVVSSQCVKVVKVYMSLLLQWVHGNSPYSKGDLGLSTDNRPPPGSKRGGASE